MFCFWICFHFISFTDLLEFLHRRFLLFEHSISFHKYMWYVCLFISGGFSFQNVQFWFTVLAAFQFSFFFFSSFFFVIHFFFFIIFHFNTVIIIVTFISRFFQFNHFSFRFLSFSFRFFLKESQFYFTVNFFVKFCYSSLIYLFCWHRWKWQLIKTLTSVYCFEIFIDEGIYVLTSFRINESNEKGCHHN